MADLAEGLERLDGGKSAIAIDAVYKVKGTQKHFAGGDAVRPHLLTTAIGHGRIAAETITHFLDGNPQDKRPKVDVHHFNLLEELHARKLDPEPYDHRQTRGTSSANFAIHNYEDRSASQIVPHTAAVQRPFRLCPRATSAPSAMSTLPRSWAISTSASLPSREEQAQGRGRALHELRAVLRVRHLRHLLPAEGD